MIAPLQSTVRTRGAAATAAACVSKSGIAGTDDDIGAIFAAEHAREAASQAELAAQQQQFNFQIEERAEMQREFNELHNLQMEQLKIDDENVKKWIALIA